MRQRQAGRHGPIWDAVRVRDDRFESVCVQQLSGIYGNRPSLVRDMIDSVEAASTMTPPSACQLYEFGQIGRNYYISGQIPEAWTLSYLTQRFRAQEKTLGIALLGHFAAQSLRVLDTCHSLVEKAWLLRYEPDNIWVGDTGAIQLGWDQLRVVPVDSNEAHSGLVASVNRIATWLSDALRLQANTAASERVPEPLSEWFRDALRYERSVATPAELAVRLEKSLAHLERHNLDDILEAERSLRSVEVDSSLEALRAMPPGARRVVAHNQVQILAQTRIRPVEYKLPHRELVTPPKNVLFQGDIGGLELVRLLYRYAAKKVSGALQLHGPDGRIDIVWSTGRMVRIVGHGAELSVGQYIARVGLVDTEVLKTAELLYEPDVDKVVQGIVALGRIGYVTLLETLQDYAAELLSQIAFRHVGRYFFTNDDVFVRFAYEPSRPLYQLLNESVTSRGSGEHVMAFFETHRYAKLERRQHKLIELSDVRITTRQLKVWHSLTNGLQLEDQVNRLVAFSNLERDYIIRTMVMLERFDFLSFSETVPNSG